MNNLSSLALATQLKLKPFSKLQKSYSESLNPKITTTPIKYTKSGHTYSGGLSFGLKHGFGTLVTKEG